MFFPDSPIADLALRTVILGPLALLWVLLVVRLVGLRSFSKMIAVDFIVTIATGSLLANAVTATQWQQFVQASGAIAILLGTQALFTVLRRKGRGAKKLENRPVLLMFDGQLRRDAMASNRIDEADVWAKLRAADVSCPSQVKAVVLETTGDISVMQGEIDEALLRGVER